MFQPDLILQLSQKTRRIPITMAASNVVVIFLSLITSLILLPVSAVANPDPADQFHDSKFFYIAGFQTRHVQVYNNLTGGSSFGIHCKSRDDDLGFQIIGPNQVYQFKFKANFWGSTLFYCGISVPGNRRAIFNLYKDKRDNNRCPRFCRWSVFPDGVHGYKEDGGAQDKFFPFK